MKKGKYAKRTPVKSIAALLAVILLIGCAVGGTIAWLTDNTEEVVNTFTVGNIDIDLSETTEEYKMIPGWTIDKDPKVTVKANSEDAWVFIEVEEKGGNVTVDGTTYTFDAFIAYQIDTNNWTELKSTTDALGNETTIYYTKYESRNDVDIDIKVLEGGALEEYTWGPNEVLTKSTVTKQMMDALTTTTAANPVELPTLTFKAYAVQLYKTNSVEFTPAEAWAKVAPTT